MSLKTRDGKVKAGQFQNFFHLPNTKRGTYIFSNSNTVWDFVGGHVVVRKLLSLIPPLDRGADLLKLPPEPFHGCLHRLLNEVFIRIHAQK